MGQRRLRAFLPPQPIGLKGGGVYHLSLNFDQQITSKTKSPVERGDGLIVYRFLVSPIPVHRSHSASGSGLARAILSIL